jgi:hypothetical protein
MSALPPKADMVRDDCDVRFVPKADIHGLIRPPSDLSDSDYGKAKRFCALQIPK